MQIPIAPAFLGKTWPFSKAVVTIAVDRNKREKERHEAIERAQEREKQPGHRPVPVRSFSAAPRITVDPEATPILQRSASEIEDSEDSHTSAGSPIKRRMTPLQLPTLVLPRAPVERDDRADPSCQYDNPFLNSPLEYHLWLPRDPLLPIDLSDSVEYRGSALVSSAGGLGRLGSKHTAPQVTELVESPIEEPLEETEVLGDDSASIQSADRSEHRRPLSAIFVTPKRRSRSNTIHSKSPASTRTSPSRFSGFEQIETAQHLGEAVSSHGPHVTFSRRDTLSPQSFETDSGLHSSQPSGIPPPTSASTSSREQVGKASYPPTNDRGRLSASALSGLSRQPSHISGTVSQADALREAVREEYRQESQSKKTRKRRNTHGEADDKREEANERAADRSWLQSRLQTSRTTAVPSVDVVQTLDGGAT